MNPEKAERYLNKIIEDSTKGVVSVAESTTDLVENLKTINEKMNDNKRISKELRTEVDKFRQ